jgi:hypothetical protein
LEEIIILQDLLEHQEAKNAFFSSSQKPLYFTVNAAAGAAVAN